MPIGRTSQPGGPRSRRLVVGLVAALLAAVGATAAVMSNAASAEEVRALTQPQFPGGGFVVHGFGGNCLDVPNRQFLDGAKLQLWDCNGTPAQVFRVGPNESLMAGDKCVDIPWASSERGTRVQLAWCNGGPAQVFRRTHWNGISNPHTGLCLDVAGWGTTNGTPFITWSCLNGANQRFTY